MIRWLITAILLVAAPESKAQDNPASPRDSSTGVIYTQVEQPPEFPGDIGRYFRNAIIYPEKAVNEGTEGVVYVNFVIDAKGIVRDANVKAGVSEELDAEAIRVIHAMPRWTPARQGGKEVAVYYTTPVRFQISD